MSEARHQRFEIDIEEIERELRRSAQAAPAPRTDPLAELARIVGQDDPFRGILGQGRQDDAANVHHLSHAAPPPPPGYAPVLTADDRYGTRDMSPQHGSGYDPVADVYGSPDAALARDDMQPLRPRRSRGKLVAVASMLLATAGSVAGGLYWYRQGGSFQVAGAPPLVAADRTPVKKPPENPGGIEVPNQDRQIYERGATDGKSRVVDGREQPIDVREAARTMPAVTDRPPAVSARAPVTGPPLPGTARDESLVPPTSAAPSAPQGGNAVSAALGEPRRVRTVAVRPDGSVYTPSGTASLADAPPSLLPGNTPPPAVPVSTVSVQSRPGATAASIASPPSVPAAAPPAAPAASEQGSTAPDAASARSAVKVLPPARPKALEKTLDEAAGAEAPTRTASAPSPARAGERSSERTSASESASGTFTVQIAVRPTEDEARAAYTQLQDKFGADLDGKPAKVTRGEANGKTVHRVRVGPMTKADATALCTKLKSSGGACFVANN